MERRDNKQWFQVPVDPVKHGCPTYFDVIKQPMDLATITEKLNTGKCVPPHPKPHAFITDFVYQIEPCALRYLQLDEFAGDVRLVWDNAIKFNPPEHLVHQAAQVLAE